MVMAALLKTWPVLSFVLILITILGVTNQLLNKMSTYLRNWERGQYCGEDSIVERTVKNWHWSTDGVQ